MRSIVVGFALMFALSVPVAVAQVPPAGTVARPAGATGIVVVPDRFLRRWDPVTVFFDRDAGPGSNTPEDDPGRFVSFSPDHPGAFTWVDRRTLQFRPVDPWPALTRFEWRVGGYTATLATLMAAPTEIDPSDGTRGLEDVQAVALTFPEPVDAAALAHMANLELRPLPGIGSAAARWLNGADFDVKELERQGPDAPVTYVLSLHAALPLATRVVLHLRLALDDAADRSFFTSSFTTAEPFRVVAVGTRSHRLPVAPEGSRYAPEQALDAGDDEPTVVVELSAAPQAVDAVAGRNLVRFEPAVAGLEYRAVGTTVEVSGRFVRDTSYRITVAASGLTDAAGRPLAMSGETQLSLFFPALASFLRWRASQGVVERFGPKVVPVEGRGEDRFDLRIYPVEPLDRSFWPFPRQPVAVDEGRRPSGPGEQPAPFATNRRISEGELTQQLAALGSPPVSELVELPLRRGGGAATFGLDLAPHLARIAQPDAPGHYLVGLRPLGEGSTRQWMRVQVTDLSLTTVEEPQAVRFIVTSLASGAPVTGATIRVEANRGMKGSWQVRTEGITGPDGSFSWRPTEYRACHLLRLVVSKGADVLVLDPDDPPTRYADNDWSSERNWLTWTSAGTHKGGSQQEIVAHTFTERPVYRPGEEVHLKAYLRRRTAGRLELIGLDKATFVVSGPGDLEWRLPTSLSDAGSADQSFHEDDPPTGEYRARLEGTIPGYGTWSSDAVSFRVEAYRVPRFEVNLHGPDRAPLDSPFDLTLTAVYYAGGRVADRPVTWRVTQFPAAWNPPDLDGYLFSSDGRFSRTAGVEAAAALEHADRTDAEGGAHLVVDPTVETSAAPRTYVVEATVTGTDDQTVTATRRVLALPPFVLGLKVPRFLPEASSLTPELVVVAGDGRPVPGQDVTVRLLSRQWHSTLRASDFSDGVARYVTDVVDEAVLERHVTSTEAPLAVDLPIPHAGVYVIEVSSRDRVGRAQVLAVDLFAGGSQPVAWPKPSSRVVEVSTDRDRYAPGDDADFVLQSPFQEAAALMIVETPDGNRYLWLSVHGGNATATLRVEDNWAPRLPVHFVLMRGRLADSGPLPGSTTDLGRPTTMAATHWLDVEPVAQQLEVGLEHPERALPGRRVDVTVRLADPDGRPLPGEVTLWLVDQAVLALGRERRLDPLPDLVTPVTSKVEVRDTRELPFGLIPFAENPGGDGNAAPEAPDLLDRATVRRNFSPVPFYDPHILVGPSGSATVSVQLPDNLTVFKLRAKAVSGAQRFGFATGELAVRLPVIVQPALPRFVRPGDRFTAVAIGRVVEGEGGPGTAEAQAIGLDLDGTPRRGFDWVPNTPQRLEFQVSVPTPKMTETGTLERSDVSLKVAVERRSDGASDAFEAVLPIRDDRRPEVEWILSDLAPGQSFDLPGPSGPVRPGSLRRSVLVSDQPGLVQMASGLDALLSYPFGCTEQRIARARARIAMTGLRSQLHLEPDSGDLERSVSETIKWIADVVDGSGLVAYWPGAQGNLALTAWSVGLMVEARDAGLRVDEALLAELLGVLERGLRSDYSHFIDGESSYERTAALQALARAGRFEAAYAAELARRSRYLSLESAAQVLYALETAGTAPPAALTSLEETLERGLVIRLTGGRESYGGLQEQTLTRNPLILPSETRTVAEIARAFALKAGDHPRLAVLVDALVRLGRGDGWGSTNADAAALLALSQVLRPPFAGATEHTVEVTLADDRSALSIGSESPLATLVTTRQGTARAVLTHGGPVVVRADARWVAAAPGSEQAASADGFVVTREELLVAAGDAPPRRVALDAAGLTVGLAVGDVVEERVEVVNPADRHFVAVVVPLAAGMEPLNPALATAPPEARASGSLSLAPTYAAFLDDAVAYYYDTLPKGAYHFAFRTRATVPGRFVQPPAFAEMMYDRATHGHGNGAWVEVAAQP